MNSYSYQPKQPMNRAERRKRGIKTPKTSKCTYTKADLEKVLKKELSDLLNQPYSEVIKRERYKRLEPLIKKYQAEKKKESLGKIDPVKAYQKEKENLKNNAVYQKLNHQTSKKVQSESASLAGNATRKKAIEAYQNQMAFSNRRPVTQKTQASQSSKVSAVSHKKTKKGFFAKIRDAFVPKKQVKTMTYKENVIKPKTIKEAKKYKKSTSKVQDAKDITFNKFERELRNFQNYCKENPSYAYNRNNRNMNRKSANNRTYRERYI